MIPTLSFDPSVILLVFGVLLLLLLGIGVLRDRTRDPLRAIQSYTQDPAASREAAQPVSTGSWEYKARLVFARYKIDVSGWERLALLILYVLLALPLYIAMRAFLFLPTVIAGLGGLIVVVFVVQGLLEHAWDRMRREIEQDIPTLMIRLSGMIQATPNVLESLDEVTQSLDPRRPLQSWMQRLVVQTQARGMSAFDELEAEAQTISSALLLAVVQIRNLWQSGGSGYVESFRLVADHLAELMKTRAMAYAKAGRSGNLSRIIVISALISLSGIMRNPTTRDMFLAIPATRLGLVVFFGWGGLGWFYIRSIIQKVTE
ncbi:MAG: hypothetical protein HN413_13285 [Chloroflexi bacterium]|jgi:hypothetical protein|nr:hypothetical protein [Chloroflexota bacterium]